MLIGTIIGGATRSYNYLIQWVFMAIVPLSSREFDHLQHNFETTSHCQHLMDMFQIHNYDMLMICNCDLLVVHLCNWFLLHVYLN
jgi:hypothetical protein